MSSAGSGARRTPVVWMVTCAAGAGLVLLASGRQWASVRYDGQAGGPRLGEVTLSGGELVPFLSSAALAALAAVVAVLAARGGWRRVIGGVVGLCGIAVALGTWSGLDPANVATVAAAGRSALASTGRATSAVSLFWPVVAVIGGVVLVGGGVAAAAVAARWSGMSSRYDRQSVGAGSDTSRTAPEPARAIGDRGLWDAIDHGTDPTADPGER